MKVFGLFLTLIFAGLGGQAGANTASAYADGAYHEAIALGEAEATAKSLVLAARAQLALIDLGRSENRKQDARAALANAEKAMALDSQNTEAHLMKVAALGILARGMSKMKSFRKGMASKSRKHIDVAMAIEPESAWAQTMLGMWHLEIIRRGGKFGARVTGANLEEGIEACALAMKSKNYDAGMGTQCGMALLICKEGLEETAIAALQQVSRSAAKGISYDNAMIARAREILDLIETEGLAAARQRALAYLSFATS